MFQLLIHTILLAWTLVFCFIASLSIYNVFIHPLRRYPGPLLARATRWYFIYYKMKGVLPFKTKELHDKYGPIVRIAPSELSYNTSTAWQDICGHRIGSRQSSFEKAPEFYSHNNKNRTISIISAEDDDHRRMRRLQSHAFSERALTSQEPILIKYVDLLISRLHDQLSFTPGSSSATNTQSPRSGIVDLVRWYNFTTFDIIGDLAFGRPFNCLSTSELHVWINMIFTSLRTANIMRALNYFPPQVKRGLFALVPTRIRRVRGKAFLFVQETARERIAQGVTRADGRADFMSYILRANDDAEQKGMSKSEMEEAASLYILAGSETTATLLSGLTYHMLKTPAAYEKVVAEIRGAFASEGNISIARLAALPYLNAVFEEALRMYPPVPSTLPRRVPALGEMICGLFVPGGTTVGVSNWATNHSAENFRDPESFVPERWLGDERYRNDDRKAMQPFSFGPRNCIGRNLAYSEMRLILGRVLWNFDLELMSEADGWAEKQKVRLLWAKGPLPVRLTKVIR